MEITKNTPIAVVGVSENTEKYGHKIFRDLLAAGYSVGGVNPRGGNVAGQKLVQELYQVKPTPELVITVVPPEITEHVIEQCTDLGITKIWMQPGSESEEAIEFAKEMDMEVIANACFMVEKKVW